MDSLPHEILHSIFQHIFHSDLSNMMRVGRKYLGIGRNIAFEKLHCRLPTNGAAADFKYGSNFPFKEVIKLNTKLEGICSLLATPELAARIRDLHFSLVIGGSAQYESLLVHDGVFRTILQYLPNAENVKSLRFDVFVDNMPSSIIHNFRNLQKLRIPGVWVQQTPGLQIRELVIERRTFSWDGGVEDERQRRRNLSTVKELPRLTSLAFLFHVGSENDSTPYLDYSSLELLKSLIVRGSAAFGGYSDDELDNTPLGIAKAVTDISFQGSIWMKSPHIWLSSFASTVRRLELTGVRTSQHVANIVLPELKILEYHWCSPQLLNGCQFPSLEYYAESIELGLDYTPLSVVRGHVGQLRIIVLRGEYSEYYRGTRSLLNIDEAITQISSAKKNGPLRAAFIEGSFVLPSAKMEPWLRCLGPIDYRQVEDRAMARISVLKEVDPKCRFAETRSNGMTHLGEAEKGIPWDACY